MLTRRPGGKVLVRCWDKDFVKQEKKWALLRKGMTPQLEERFKKQLQEQGSGTVVLWEILDRLGHDSRNSDIADRLKLEVARLEEHLSMVFHRYLEEPGRLQILIGEVPVKPWDPFMRGEKATQILGEEHLELAGHAVDRPALRASPCEQDERRGPPAWGRPQEMGRPAGLLRLSQPSPPRRRELAAARVREGRAQQARPHPARFHERAGFRLGHQRSQVAGCPARRPARGPRSA